MDMLEDVAKAKGIQYRVIAIDPNESRCEKMRKVADTIGGLLPGSFRVANISEGKKVVNEWTGDIGCNAVLEVGKYILSPSSQLIMV